MPITASVGSLHYPKNAEPGQFDYWYLETNQNAIFNNFVSGGLMAVVGRDTTNNKALLMKLNAYAGRPQIQWQVNQFNDTVGEPTDGIYRGVFYQSPNLYAYGTFATTGTYSNRSVVFPTNNFTVPPSGVGGTLIKNYYPYLTSTFDTTSICSMAPYNSAFVWTLYRDYNRLIYRISDYSNFNVVGPLTYVSTSTPGGAYVPQGISKYSNDDAVVCLNLGGNGKPGGGANLIRRVNKTFVNATYDYYPTIWQRQYNGVGSVIYDQILQSDNLYFVSSASNRGDIGALDSSGTSLWSRETSNVFLTGIAYYSSYIYVSGYLTTNGNLYIAKYDLSGVMQWNTELSGATFTDSKIKVDGTGIYVVGSVGTYGFALKVPSDGSIPLGNTFELKGNTYTYSTSAITDTTGGTFTTPTTTDTSLALFGNNNFRVDSAPSNYVNTVINLDA